MRLENKHQAEVLAPRNLKSGPFWGWASKAASYLLLIALALFLVAPFVWMVLISLREPKTTASF